MWHARSLSPIRDWTHAPCSGSTESQPLDSWGSPPALCLKNPKFSVKEKSWIIICRCSFLSQDFSSGSKLHISQREWRSNLGTCYLPRKVLFSDRWVSFSLANTKGKKSIRYTKIQCLGLARCYNLDIREPTGHWLGDQGITLPFLCIHFLTCFICTPHPSSEGVQENENNSMTMWKALSLKETHRHATQLENHLILN